MLVPADQLLVAQRRVPEQGQSTKVWASVDCMTCITVESALWYASQ